MKPAAASRKAAGGTPVATNPLAAIESAMPNLAPAERRVAQLLLADPHGFVRLPVGEMARLAGVSNPTVVRFCRSLGHRGLADFKLDMASALGNGRHRGEPFVHAQVDSGDSLAQIIAKLTQGNARALTTFGQRANATAYQQAQRALVASIRGRARIEFYGVGNSGIVANDAQHKFFRLGCNTVAYADGHLQIMAATLLGRKDTAVVISNSGRSRDLLDASRVARAQGATVIAITASDSPLAASARIVLAADHTESFDQYSPMVSRLLHLSIIDILATSVALALGAPARDRQRRIKANLSRLRWSE